MSRELKLDAATLVGGLRCTTETAPLDGAAWLEADAQEAGLVWDVPAGTFNDDSWLTYDALLDGNRLVTFHLRLSDAKGNTFRLKFGLLNQAQARVRLAAERLYQNAWMLPREAAFLKPLCDGEVVNPKSVVKVELIVSGKHPDTTARWAMTDIAITDTEPAMLDAPLLPAGPLLDELGQSTQHDWPTKTPDAAALVENLREQLHHSDAADWPDGWSRWGGLKRKGFNNTGWFRTQHDGRRWWLVDPDGCAFWSNGPDCVSPGNSCNITGLRHALSWHPIEDGGEEFAPAYVDGKRGPHVNYPVANLIRAFGEQWRLGWTEMTTAELKRCGFNTVANWADRTYATTCGLPYVRQLEWRSTTPTIFRDFPDVYHPQFEKDATAYAEQIKPFIHDRAMIGYFLMNEPTWGFSEITPAEGMLINTETCATRVAFAKWLKQKYGDDLSLTRAWDRDATFTKVEKCRWHAALSEPARADCAAFSTVMVARHYDVMSQACHKIDSNHLNLGARYYRVPPDWALRGMGSFDVFSINCYAEVPNADEINHASAMTNKPVMIGEWHFGALDVGLPAPGIRQVRTQAERGRAFRRFVEHAAAIPACIGAHYFQWSDQSALGRFDGEHYQIGVVDCCHRAYPEMVDAARVSAERIYDVAMGTAEAYDDAPEYLPMLFLGA